MSSFTVQAATLKKIKIHVETLHSTKMKEEKASKGGKKGGKGRSTVKMDLQKVISANPNEKYFREITENCKISQILIVLQFHDFFL